MWEQCVQGKNGQTNHTQKKSSHHSVTSLTKQRAVRQPKKHSPLRLTDTSRSTSLHSACKNGRRVDANASSVLTTRPSGGRSCPRVPIAIPLHNCLVTSYHAHPRARSPGFTRQGQSTRYCASRSANTPVALARWKSLQKTKLPRPYLKFPLIE